MVTGNAWRDYVSIDDQRNNGAIIIRLGGTKQSAKATVTWSIRFGWLIAEKCYERQYPVKFGKTWTVKIVFIYLEETICFTQYQKWSPDTAPGSFPTYITRIQFEWP